MCWTSRDLNLTAAFIIGTGGAERPTPRRAKDDSTFDLTPALVESKRNAVDKEVVLSVEVPDAGERCIRLDDHPVCRDPVADLSGAG